MICKQTHWTVVQSYWLLVVALSIENKDPPSKKGQWIFSESIIEFAAAVLAFGSSDFFYGRVLVPHSPKQL